MEQIPAIRLDHVNVTLDRRRIFSNATLTIQRGERVVVLGGSGSGKSVLLKLLIGLLAPSSGSVEIDGKNWHTLREEERLELRRRIGLVFQESALFDGMTIAENIALPLELRGNSEAGEMWQRVGSLLAEVGLSEEDGERQPVELSGGMQKRAAIARTLAAKPQIILYDEPTAGLDAANGERIYQLINTVHQAHPGAVSLVVTHDSDAAAFLADRLFFLRKESGAFDELTPQLQALRQTHGENAARHAAVKRWIEDVCKEPQQAHAFTQSAAQQPSPLAAAMRSSLRYFNAIGQLLFLFFEMGFPLRRNEFRQRLIRLGLGSLPMVAVAGVFIGMIVMMQFYAGIGAYEALLQDNIPPMIGLVFVKILSPLLVGLLLAGRIGSSVSAEIGAKTYLRQIDALETLSIPPKRFLLAPIVFALAIMTPVMSLVCGLSGIAGGAAVWVSFGKSLSAYQSRMFDLLTVADVMYVAAKSIIIGVMIGLVSYQQGAEPKWSSEEIASAATNTVLLASLLVVIVDFIMSTLYTRLMG